MNHTAERNKDSISRLVDDLNSEAYDMRSKDPELSKTLSEKALQISIQNGYSAGEAWGNANLGYYYINKGEHRKSLNILSEAQKNFISTENQQGLMRVRYNLGVLNIRLGNFQLAYDFLAECYLRSIEEKDHNTTAKCHYQFASIKMANSNLLEAYDEVELAIQLERDLGNELGVAAALTLQAQICMRLDRPQKAHELISEGMELRLKNNEQLGYAGSNCYWIQLKVELGFLEKAQSRIEETAHIYEKLNLPIGKGIFYQLRARVELLLGNTEASISWHEKVLGLCKQYNLKALSYPSYQALETIMAKSGDFEKAYNLSKKHKEMLILEGKERLENHFQSLKLFAEIEYAKREAVLVKLQNDILVEKNSKIDDMLVQQKQSILNAKRIQDILLPSEENLELLFSKYFVVNLPKDVVSGDFYWSKNKGSKKVFLLGDCTGHGVPGALLSIVCANELSTSVDEEKSLSPAAILNRMSQSLIEKFYSRSGLIKDGMDAAIFVLEKNILQFSGAYRPLYLVRNGQIMIFRGDRQPIGYHDKRIDFIEHEIKLELGDQIYLFSDGVTDQFGGARNKKLKAVALKEELCRISKFPIQNRKEEFIRFFSEWKGHQDQVDDVILFGFEYEEEPQ